MLVEIELVEILLAVISPVLTVLLTDSDPPRDVLLPAVTVRALLNVVFPVTPKVLLITVTPANKLEIYPLFVEMLFVEILEAVINPVLTVLLTESVPPRVVALLPVTVKAALCVTKAAKVVVPVPTVRLFVEILFVEIFEAVISPVLTVLLTDRVPPKVVF